MRVSRILLGVVTVFFLAMLAGFAWTWRPAIAPISANEKPATDKQAINHGAELASIGNCSDCHTTRTADETKSL